MKKLMALLMAVMLMAGCMPIAGAERTAPANIAPAQDFEGGSGTAEDPYRIADAAQLALMQQRIHEENESFSGDYSHAHYVLTADIALNDVSDAANWAVDAPEYTWDPIGKYYACFDGVFDGNGHTISGMYIHREETEGVYNGNGLFGRVRGVIRNLTVENSYIGVTGASADVGGIVGTLIGEDALIENCVSAVTIDGYSGAIGGVAGHAMTMSNMKDCIFTGEIRQVKEKSVNYLGGIVGTVSAKVSGCVNRGMIRFGDCDVSAVGGVAGRIGYGILSDCANEGTLETVAGDEGSPAGIGGIAGTVFLSNIGGEFAGKGVVIENCVNRSAINYSGNVGGIVGSACNRGSEYELLISGCRNEGALCGSEHAAGIVAELVADDGAIRLENCSNTGEIVSDDVAGGVVAYFSGISGKLKIAGCENIAPVRTTGLNAAGIVAYWLGMFEGEVEASVERCVNSGAVTSSKHAGGILGHTDNTGAFTPENAALSVIGCRNSGAITGTSSNSFAGGIAANIGMVHAPARIQNCVNTGDVMLRIEIDEATIAETVASPVTFTLSQMVGGIVGRAGKGLMLTTDADVGEAGNIGAENALVTIEDCYSTGMVDATDYSAYTDSNGKSIWRNYIGGIVGQASAEDSMSLAVIHCGFANAERGFGSTEYDDLGKRMSVEEIETVIADMQ